MTTAFQFRRDLAKKKAHLAYLRHYLSENLPLVIPHFETGFFALCAEKLREHAKQCQDIADLQADIMQLSLDIERLDAEQAELPLSSVNPS